MPTAVPPRKDPQVQLAQLVRRQPADAQAPAADQTAQAVPAPAPVPSLRPAQDPEPPIVDLPPIDGAPEVVVPNLDNPEDVPRAAPLPARVRMNPLPRCAAMGRSGPPPLPSPPTAPIMAGSQRVTSIFPRSGRKVDIQALPVTPDGTRTFIYRGGVNIVTRHPKFGIIDIEAESAVIWKHPDPKKGQGIVGPNGELIEDPNQPMEVYAEGDVILRQDENKVAGRADQRTFRAKRAFYDFLTDRFLALDGEVDVFAPGFIAPMKIKSPRIEQFHRLITRPDGTIVPDDNPEIRADQTVMTGSRFPNPAYQINNRFVDLTRKTKALTDPNTGRLVGDPNDPKAPMDLTWRYDARQNVFWMGWVPVFYWPRLTGDTDDLEAPLRQIGFRTNNYFGQQVLSDWNGFKVFGLRRPDWIDNWNIDIDYLSTRTKDFPALGSELGWFGRDLFRDLTDPYHKIRTPGEHITYDYFGYMDIWGLKDQGIDVLGSGPAIVTNGPPGAGKKGYQRSDRAAVPGDPGPVQHPAHAAVSARRR